MKHTMIGVDLAKRIFQLHGTDLHGNVIFRKKMTREQFRRFMSEQPPSIVVFEACSSANFWAHVMTELGHDVKLISPQYVKPFVKRQKNDAADAEAIAIAARQPEMRFVAPKTVEQQAKAVLFRGRDRIVHQRTELINALRAVLFEQGYVFAKGIQHLKQMDDLVHEPDNDLHPLIQEECLELLDQIAEQTIRIHAKNEQIKKMGRSTEKSRCLQTMSGVGPITAVAIEAFAPDMSEFKCGRDFAAWLGLVPRQHSTGGKTRLGRTSKAGQKDIRRLLIMGAMSRLNRNARRSLSNQSWLSKMLERKPVMLVAIALANKMARQIWAMLTKNETYRDPFTVDQTQPL